MPAGRDVYLVVAEQGHTDGSTTVVVGHADTREEAQAWVGVLGFEVDVFRGELAAWLSEHPDPNPRHGDAWAYPEPGSELSRREQQWRMDLHDEATRLRARMRCPLGADERLDDGSTFDGPPDLRVEVSRSMTRGSRASAI